MLSEQARKNIEAAAKWIETPGKWQKGSMARILANYADTFDTDELSLLLDDHRGRVLCTCGVGALCYASNSTRFNEEMEAIVRASPEHFGWVIDDLDSQQTYFPTKLDEEDKHETLVQALAFYNDAEERTAADVAKLFRKALV